MDDSQLAPPNTICTDGCCSLIRVASAMDAIVWWNVVVNPTILYRFHAMEEPRVESQSTHAVLGARVVPTARGRDRDTGVLMESKFGRG
jgi:hypothetical protein